MAEPEPDDAVLFVGVSLVLGIASRHLLRGTRVPYTVALLVLGVALGSLGANINPDLLLAVFLPALLFESSFSMEIHQIKRCMAQMVLLAGPGVVVSTFLLGSAVKLTFPYNWSWKTSLLLGGLLSATDPVAVVALLKELGASKKLSTIIEGESLMNDGTAIVVYQLFYRMVLGRTFDAGSIMKFLSEVSLGAVALGLAFGIVSALWLGFIFNDTIIEISLTLAVSYIAFFTLRILKYTRYEMLNKALEAFGELRDDEELGPADWATVKKYITCLNDLDDDLEHPHDVGDNDDRMHTMNLRDIRVRLLNGTYLDLKLLIYCQNTSPISIPIICFLLQSQVIVKLQELLLTKVMLRERKLENSWKMFELHSHRFVATMRVYHSFNCCGVQNQYHSVVHCFFIEAEKIDELRQTDPSIEVFLWQEPESDHTSRERKEGSLGVFMLAAVNHIDYCHTAPSYQVETRARIIFFDIGRALEGDADLHRSVSLVSQGGHEPARTMNKEHSGLLSWPESFRRSRGPNSSASLAEIRNHPGSFSARALQLSMYGSMVNLTGQGHRRQRPPRLPAAKQRHSSSYPRVPSRPSNTRPLLFVQSEGSNMKRMAGEAAAAAPTPATSAGQQRPRTVTQDDNSSDDSAGEEVIVRVDSPSMLSFRQSSAAVDSPPPPPPPQDL
ncbi:hypothetical protein HU200_060850 [Digitaria exilis]|uniref:Cation/H+ exchanger transmembrane domain-containing protein n=1 Tax=Digitaria exilis TaxID=1010633 RepID=A0A835AA11_9POAL|nr:hypothetical protein HU200_060850 [Digitaria exilis]